MDLLVLTKTGGVFGPIAEILGWIMEALFQFTSQYWFKHYFVYSGYETDYVSNDTESTKVQ